jgi:hypothetical protein
MAKYTELKGTWRNELKPPAEIPMTHLAYREYLDAAGEEIENAAVEFKLKIFELTCRLKDLDKRFNELKNEMD